MTATVDGFEAATVERWRSAAIEAQRDQCLPDAGNGWSLSEGRPAQIIDAFPLLGLQPGWDLRAFVYRNSGNGHSWVFAVPDGISVAPPPPGEQEPPLPAGASADPMVSVDGDRSPDSYLQASILLRELREWCARGHGAEWRLHHVLGADPWSEGSDGEVSPSRRHPTGNARMWSWEGRLPESFAPVVLETASGMVVTFYTYTALGQEQIIRHSDTYDSRDYTSTPERELVGVGRNGYRI